MSTLKIQASSVFETLWEAIQAGSYRVVLLKGGSRSGKTWAIIQSLILMANQGKYRITTWREKRTWCKATCYRDFVAYLKSINLYNQRSHNQSDLIYSIEQSSIEFNGLDDAQKLHGLTQDISWINEAVEATKNDFDQLEMRTRKLMILDCNPTEEESWVYELEKRPDVLVLHSTQKDNPFLEQSIRNKILSYEPTDTNIKQGTADEYKWQVYGLGLAARREGLIYPNWEIVKDWPAEARLLGHGLDFGFFPDPVAFARVGLMDGRLVIDEQLYENDLNNIRISERPELPSIQQRFEELGIARRAQIVADSAAKVSISELKGAGYNVIPVHKYPGSVKEGIELTQKYMPFYITETSLNTIKELKNYTWKKNFSTGLFLKDPIDDFNHILDLVRYVVQTFAGRPRTTGGKWTM